MTNVNPNTHFPHGDDPSVSDATGPVVITEGEQAALSNTSMEKEDKTPRTEMGDSDIHTSQGVDALHSDVTAPVVNQAGEGALQPQATKDDTHRTGESVVEFIWYSSRKYRESSLAPLLDLERAQLVVDVWESYHGGDHSFSLYKIWFDFASHKVIDVQKIKWFRLKTATYGLGAQPPDDLPENTFEFCPIENKDAFANIQKAFDSSYLQDFLKACELRFRFPTTAPYPKSFMMTETTSAVASPVVNQAGEEGFQTGVVTYSGEPPTHTPPDQPENALEFEDFDDPNPIACAQALFDHPENPKLLDECEKELSKASPESKGRMMTDKLEPVMDIIVFNPDLPGPDGAEPVAGKSYRVKFNLVTWKVLSFKEMPQGEEGTAEELRRDPPSQDIAIMDVDEDVPEEATRDLAGMQRFFDDPARNTFFCGLGELLMKIYPTRTVNVA